MKETTTRILRNSASLMAARTLTKLGTAAVYILAARSLGEEEYGLFSSLIAFMALFAIVEEFGLTMPMIRRIALDRGSAGGEVGRLLVLKAMLGCLAVLLFVPTALVAGLPAVPLCLFAVSMFFENISVSFVRSFEGFERMTVSAALVIGERSLFLVLGLGVLMGKWGLAGLAFVHAATNAALFAASWFAFRRVVGPVTCPWSMPVVRARIIEGIPFVIAAGFSVLYNRVDVFLLTTFRTNAELGQYAAAFRIVEAQIFFPMALVAAVFPVLARSAQEGREQFAYYFRRAFTVLMGIGTAGAVVIYALAPWIVRVLYGPRYFPSIELIRVLVGMSPFFFGNFILGNGLIALGKERFSTVTIGIGAVICATIGLVAVPALGARGAGGARVAAEVISFVVQAWLLVRVYGSAEILRPVLGWRSRTSAGTGKRA